MGDEVRMRFSSQKLSGASRAGYNAANSMSIRSHSLAFSIELAGYLAEPMPVCAPTISSNSAGAMNGGYTADIP